MDHEAICDLARLGVLEKVQDMISDRMSQGEHLEEFLKGDDDTHDNKVFATYETYLRKIYATVKHMPIRLSV